MSVPVFYSSTPLLSQAQSPSQLSGWFSQVHPGYNLVSWCFYGNLINESGEAEALATVNQFINTPSLPQSLDNIGIRPFQSGFCFCGENTQGYLITGDAGLSPKPELIVSDAPWSIQILHQDTESPYLAAISLVEGDIGQKGARYHMGLYAHYIQSTPSTNSGQVKIDIELEDTFGALNLGYSSAAFLPQYLTPAQQESLQSTYNNDLAAYLSATQDPMFNQGSYYYCMPLLEVKNYTVHDGNNTLISQGTGGHLWVDYVVQSFTKTNWPTLSAASWKFFAIQFPEQNSAVIISQVTTKDPASKLLFAKYYEGNGPTHPNGARQPSQTWSADQISFTPDPSSSWTSPNGDTYILDYDVVLSSETMSMILSIQAARKNQEIVLEINGSKMAKYEGVFNVTAKVGTPSASQIIQNWTGMAWSELVNAGSGT